MATSFSIPRSRCTALSDPDLRAEIQSHTGNESDTSSILRSMGRFGEDLSILFYEVTPKSGRRTFHVSSTSTWTVSAVR